MMAMFLRSTSFATFYFCLRNTSSDPFWSSAFYCSLDWKMNLTYLYNWFKIIRFLFMYFPTWFAMKTHHNNWSTYQKSHKSIDYVLYSTQSIAYYLTFYHFYFHLLLPLYLSTCLFWFCPHSWTSQFSRPLRPPIWHFSFFGKCRSSICLSNS